MNKWLKRGLTALLCSLFCLTGALGLAACDKGKDSSDSSSGSVSESTEDSSAEHKHDYTETIIVEASCKAEGQKKLTCACGDEKTESIPMSAHVEEVLKEVPATCTSTGLTEGKKCSTCGDILVEQEVIQKKAHDFTAQNTDDRYCASEATCESVATYYYSCTVCGNADTKTFESGSVRAHAWIEKVDGQYLVSKATCTAYAVYNKSCEHCGIKGTETFESGVKADHVFDKKDTGEKYVATKAACEQNATYYYSCNACGEKGTETFEDVGSALDHDFKDQDTSAKYFATAAACGQNETYYYSCIACGEKGTETFEKAGTALSHVFENKDTSEKYFATAAACEKNETYYYSCTACGAKSTETFEKLGTALAHEYTGELVEPTCLEEGYYVYTCGKCNHKYSDMENMVAATGHEYEEVVTPATCTAQGYTTYKCSCGDSYVGNHTEIAQHDYQKIETIASTCQAKGYDLFECADCGDTKQDNYQDLAEHQSTEEITKAATCEEAGIKTIVYTCACNKTLTEKINPTNHNYVAGTPVAPTCTEGGYTVYTCSNDGCGHSYQADETDATGHQSYTGVVTQAPTCTEKGIRTYTCDACDDSYTEEIDETGHDCEPTNTVAPTCTEEGYTTYTCQNGDCGYTYNDNFTDATGHDHQEVETKQPTCTEKGYIRYECACGDEYSTELEENGHTIDENAWVLVTDGEGNEILTQVSGCTYEKTYTQTCGTCSEVVEKTEEVIKHNYAVAITETATCLSEGVKTFTCTVEGCGHSYDEAYSVSVEEGHIWSTPSTTGGVETVVCTVGCGAEKTTIKAEEGATNAVVDKGALSQTGEIQMDAATIKMDENVKNQLTGGEGELDIHASTLGEDDKNAAINNVTDPALRDKLQTQPIFNFTVEDENGTISQFEGKMTVTVPYDLNGQDAEGIAVYFLNDNGEIEEIKAIYTEINGQGYATFETDHFSKYTVVRLTPSERCALYGHDWKNRTVNATCTTDGYYLKYCIRCGTNETIEVYTATGHDYTAYVTTATCTTQGYTTYVCENENCGSRYNADFVAALGHNYTTEITEPTCTTRGYTTYTCQNDNCGNSYNSNFVAALGHSYTEEVTEPTCEDKGYTTYTCHCGYQYVSDYKAALGHDYQEDGVEEPTCTAPGHTKFKCHCGKSYNGKYTPAKGHKYGQGNKHDATCQKGGYTEYKCEHCGDQYEADFTPTTKHDYDANGVKHDATCYEKGYTRHTCKYCEAYYDDKFEDKKKHEYEATVIAPTCTAKGYTLYTCKHHGNCKDSYKSDYVPALGHVWGSDYICTREGCGAEHPALSHGNQGFYINLRDSVMNAASYYVTLENFKYDETDTQNDVVTETHIGNVTILRFTFAFDDNGYIVGHGEFEMPFVHSDYEDGEVSYEENETFAAKVIFAGGYVYVFTSDAEDEYIAENYVMIPQEVLETEMNFPILQLKTMYLQFYGENARKLLTAALGTTDADVNAALGSVMEFLFVKTETGEGYTFTIDADQIYNVIEKLATQSVKEIFDTFFGAGALDRLFDWAEELLDKTVGELEADIEENLIAAGYTLDDLYGFINDTVKTIVGEEAEEFDVREMIDEIRGEVIGDMLVNGMFEGEMTVEDVKDMLSQIRDMCADNNIISLIFQMTEEADSKEEADEYVDELLEEAKDISKYIGETEITISTNKKGLASAIEFNLDIKVESKMNGSLFTRVNTIHVTGNGKITLNESYEMDFADLKDKIEGLFDKIDLKDGAQIGEYIIYRNGNDMIIARDVTVLMNSQPDYMESLGTEEIDGVSYEKYSAMWSYIRMERPDGGISGTSNDGYYFENGYGIATDDVCGDWSSYSLLGRRCDVYYTLWVNMESGSFRSEIDWDKTQRYYMESSSFDFWYNATTGEYSDHSMHNYCEVERHEPETCGEIGWQVFKCTTCGDSYKSTWTKDHNIEWKYELLEGATSCIDGVAEVRYCTECDYEEKEITNNLYHDYRWESITIQTDCGEVHIGYYVCACGYEYNEYIEVNGECKFEEFSGDKIEKYGLAMDENVMYDSSSSYSDYYGSGDYDSGYEEPMPDMPEEDSKYCRNITYVCQTCGKAIVLTITKEYEDCYQIGSFTITVDEEVVVEKEYSIGRHRDVTSTYETVDGITTETRTCACGVVVSVWQRDEWGRELYYVTENGFGYAYEYTGCEYEYYQVTPNERIHIRSGMRHASSETPVYVLMDGANSCLDGVYGERYCACCGKQTDRWEVFEEEHSFNLMEKVIETPCGSLTIRYGTCACGEEKRIDNYYSNGCEFIGIGTTAFRCEKCGLTLVLSHETAQEGCTEITTFVCNVYMDGDVNGVAAWTFEGHFSEVSHSMNNMVETDENGNKVVTYGCEVCSYFEYKYTYDQYNREIRYERANGSGYYYVYNDDCTYTRYEFDRFGDEYVSGRGQWHVRKGRRVFIGEANCEAGVRVEYYCVVCGQTDKSYEYYRHEWFDQIVYESITACGTVRFIRSGCLCGLNSDVGKGLRVDSSCSFNSEEVWFEDTDAEFNRCLRTYTCWNCGWTYTQYTYETQEACTTRYYTVYTFGLNGDTFDETYTTYREEVRHLNIRLEEGANDQGVYVYERYCTECGEWIEHWERDYDDSGREIYYMDRLNGYGWERVYSDTDCTYVQYELDQLGNRVDSYEGFAHASIYTRCELMEGATTCDQGIYVIEYCIACNMITSQYNEYYHRSYEHIEKFDTYCDGGVTVRYDGCACGLRHDNWLYVSGGCNIEYTETTWPDFDEANPKYDHYIEHYKCAITACKFSYTVEYYCITAEDTCMATYVRAYTLYNGEEVIYTKTFTWEGHNAQIEGYTETDANGYLIHVNDCKYCDWVEKYDRYGRTIYYWNPYDNYGYRRDYYDGCDYYHEEFNSDGVYYSYYGTDHQLHWREIYQACTQYGTAFEYCSVCGWQNTYDYVEPGHEYRWDEEQGLYVCARCGLKNEKDTDGDFLVEDLTYQYGVYTAGFFNRLGKEWQMDEGYNFYIMLNYTVDEDGNVIDGVNVTDQVAFDFFTYGYETEPAGSGIITLNGESLWNAIREVYGENAEGYQHVSIVFQVFDKYEEVDGNRYYSYVDHVLTFGV